MNKIFTIFSLITTTCFCCPSTIIDPLDDPELSVAAKCMWVCIISQDPLPEGESYFDDLEEDDLFYPIFIELKSKGYI